MITQNKSTRGSRGWFKWAGFSFSALLCLALFLSGCSSSASADISVSPGQEFKLPIGKTASLRGENLTLKFTAVTADSRCPNGAQCIRAGEALCSVELVHDGVTSNAVFSVQGLTQDNVQKILNKFNVTFNLEPYPQVGRQIANDEYVLLLKISSGP
jgi:hypothetical protein